MSAFNSLSFIGRRRGGRYRKFWSAGVCRAGETMADLGRARADEFLAYLNARPDQRAVLDRIIHDMPAPLGPMEVAFLAKVKQEEPAS